MFCDKEKNLWRAVEYCFQQRATELKFSLMIDFLDSILRRIGNISAM